MDFVLNTLYLWGRRGLANSFHGVSTLKGAEKLCETRLSNCTINVIVIKWAMTVSHFSISRAIIHDSTTIEIWHQQDKFMQKILSNSKSKIIFEIIINERDNSFSGRSWLRNSNCGSRPNQSLTTTQQRLDIWRERLVIRVVVIRTHVELWMSLFFTRICVIRKSFWVPLFSRISSSFRDITPTNSGCNSSSAKIVKSPFVFIFVDNDGFVAFFFISNSTLA